MDSKRRTGNRSKEQTNERPSEQKINAKSIANRPEIDEKSMTNRAGAPWGRPGAIGGASGTLGGHLGNAPGRYRDVLERPPGPSQAHQLF